MGHRKNDSSKDQHHQRTNEILAIPSHAHEAADHKGKGEHLTGNEQMRKDAEHRDTPKPESGEKAC